MYQVIGADGVHGDSVDLPVIKEMAAARRIGPATLVFDPISGRTLPACDMFVHENLFALGGETVYAPRPPISTFDRTPPVSVAVPPPPGSASTQGRFGAPPAMQHNIPQSAYPPPQYPTVIHEQKSKIAAGLFAIFFPYLGIHGFYTGNTALGLTVLLSTIGCMVLTVISFGILIILTLPALVVIHILSIIQGILYLSASDAEFQQKYVIEKRWF